jgi:hypothetical protein
VTYFALTDVDWPWDDQDEGRAIVVSADTPEQAVKLATEILLSEEPNRDVVTGGVSWKVSQLMGIGFQSVEWDGGKPDYSDEFVNYPEGANGPLIKGGGAPASVVTPVAWTHRLQMDRLKSTPKESAAMWGEPNGTICIPLFAAPTSAAEPEVTP